MKAAIGFLFIVGLWIFSGILDKIGEERAKPVHSEALQRIAGRITVDRAMKRFPRRKWVYEDDIFFQSNGETNQITAQLRMRINDWRSEERHQFTCTFAPNESGNDLVDRGCVTE
jgi:hypothetical protein